MSGVTLSNKSIDKDGLSADFVIFTSDVTKAKPASCN